MEQTNENIGLKNTFLAYECTAELSEWRNRLKNSEFSELSAVSPDIINNVFIEFKQI